MLAAPGKRTIRRRPTNAPSPDHSCHGNPMPIKKRPLTVADLWSIKRVGSPTMSPRCDDEANFGCNQ